MYITIDGGTTNTRISLVSNLQIIQTVKLPIGAGSCINGTSKLKSKVRDSINKILDDNNITERDVEKIIASGMITSEYGLCPLKHIEAPVGIDELHKSMHEMVIEDISDIPFVFIRGVKLFGGTVDTSDVMRGEETELMGLIDSEEDGVYVLPGSHSKIISVKNNKIVSFSTMMTGEMIAALSKNTILKASFDLSEASLVEEYLFKGYEYCCQKGINEALFKTRVLDTVFGRNNDELYSFFMGVVLCDEIKSIIKADARRVVIGGNKNIKQVMGKILKKYSDKRVVAIKDEEVLKSTSIGAIKIYEGK